MALVYDRDDVRLPTYVPRVRRLGVAPAYERARSFIGTLGALVTFDRFRALLDASAAFSPRDRETAASAWAIGFHEGVRASWRVYGRELPPFEEAYAPPVDDGVIGIPSPHASPLDPRSARSKACSRDTEEGG